eukprot:857750-Pelagomonas_calceolata.AAC.10
MSHPAGVSSFSWFSPIPCHSSKRSSMLRIAWPTDERSNRMRLIQIKGEAEGMPMKHDSESALAATIADK